jgi:hypothetical protein
MSSLVRLILKAFAARTDDAQYGSCSIVPTARGLIGVEMCGDADRVRAQSGAQSSF